MKKFHIQAEATNRWTFEKRQAEGTISADSEAWARIGVEETLAADGYSVGPVEVREIS